MNNYLEHLDRIQSEKTANRKIEYIRHNFGHLIPDHPSKSFRILEIGPGYGELIQYLNTRKITNIDIFDNDKSVISHIKKTHSISQAFYGQRVDKVTTKLNKYDLIVATQVFEHIPKPEYHSFITTIYSALKPGGKIIITVPNGGNPLNIVERYGDLQHENAFTVNSLKDIPLYHRLANYNAQVMPYKIPPSNLINYLRIIVQAALHLLLLLAYIANGGEYQTLFHPNISLVLTKNTDSQA